MTPSAPALVNHDLPGLDLAVLRPLLAEKVDIVGDLRAEVISGGRSNLTYRILDDASMWVFRRPPTAGLTPSAHDVEREFTVMAALQGSEVPVAPTLLMCSDPAPMGAPFVVVGHVDGRTLRTQSDLARIDDTELERCADELVRVLAQLHAIEPAEVGLSGFGRPGYVGRQVALWRRQWDLVSREASADVDRLHQQLAERVPSERRSAIVHGDYRIDNTMVDRDDAGRIKAVVDWELSTLGDSRADLAMTCVYRHPAFDHIVGEPAASTSPRMADAESLADRYATVSGDDLGDWAFYLGLAHFKLAVIAAGIQHRHDQGASGEDSSGAGAAVPDLIAAGLAALKPTHRYMARTSPAEQEKP